MHKNDYHNPKATLRLNNSFLKFMETIISQTNGQSKHPNSMYEFEEGKVRNLVMLFI